jgi:hypothetical protein
LTIAFQFRTRSQINISLKTDSTAVATSCVSLRHSITTAAFIAAQDLFAAPSIVRQSHPREVVKEALKHKAAKVILAHLRPSGVAEPSKADEYITERVKQALALVDIKSPRPLLRRILKFHHRGPNT